MAIILRLRDTEGEAPWSFEMSGTTDQNRTLEFTVTLVTSRLTCL